MPGLPPLLSWLIAGGQRNDTLLPALRHAADDYQRRAQYQAELSRVMLPVFVTCSISARDRDCAVLRFVLLAPVFLAASIVGPRGESTVTFPSIAPNSPASLNAEESAELSARLAALAQSGLPLEGGLTALADEVARPRLARVLRNLAARLERGEKLETAIAAQGSRLPAHLRGLIVAGVRSGRLPIVLDQFAALARRQQDLRRRVLLALAYPALLLGIMAALMVFCHLLLSQQFVQIFRDFNTKLPDITDLYFRFSGVVAWTMLGLTIVAVMVPLAGHASAAGGLARPRDVVDSGPGPHRPL